MKKTPRRTTAMKVINLERFEEVKKALSKKKATHSNVAQLFKMSQASIHRIGKAKTFEEFKAGVKQRTLEIAKARSEKTTPKKNTAKVVSMKLVKKAPEEKKKETKPNVTQSVISALFQLSVVIELQTQAVNKNTKAIEELRERVAKANSMRAQQMYGIHNKGYTKKKGTVKNVETNAQSAHA